MQAQWPNLNQFLAWYGELNLKKTSQLNRLAYFFSYSFCKRSGLFSGMKTHMNPERTHGLELVVHACKYAGNNAVFCHGAMFHISSQFIDSNAGETIDVFGHFVVTSDRNIGGE